MRRSLAPRSWRFSQFIGPAPLCIPACFGRVGPVCSSATARSARSARIWAGQPGHRSQPRRAFGVSAFLIMRWGWFPRLPDWVAPATIFGFLVCGFLALASIGQCVARLCSANSVSVSNLLERWHWKRILRALPDDARCLLAVVEADAIDQFYYDPRSPAISVLRDRDILKAVRVSRNGDRWGKFYLTYAYNKAYQRHRPTFRAALRYSHGASAQVRATI